MYHQYSGDTHPGVGSVTWRDTKKATWAAASSRGRRQPGAALRVETSCPATVHPLISRSFFNKNGRTHSLRAELLSHHRPVRATKASANRELNLLQPSGAADLTSPHRDASPSGAGKWKPLRKTSKRASRIRDGWVDAFVWIWEDELVGATSRKRKLHIFLIEPMTNPRLFISPPWLACRHMNILHFSQYKNIFKATLKPLLLLSSLPRCSWKLKNTNNCIFSLDFTVNKSIFLETTLWLLTAGKSGLIKYVTCSLQKHSFPSFYKAFYLQNSSSIRLWFIVESHRASASSETTTCTLRITRHANLVANGTKINKLAVVSASSAGI